MEALQFLQYGFIQKALVTGAFIGMLCSVLGLFLVLRKMSLIGDGLAHVSFGAVALGLLLNIYPFYMAIPVAVLGSYVILKLTQKAKMYGDAAIGMVSAVGIAGGVILASLSKGFNVDLFSYLFGNILAISDEEVVISMALSVIVLSIIVFFYNDLFAVTFDEEYARVIGIKTDYINSVLFFLTAVTVVLAIRVVGIMLISALLILPAVTALQIAQGFKGAMLVSAMVAIFSVLSGIPFSFFLDLPAGATIVMDNLLIFACVLVYRISRKA